MQYTATPSSGASLTFAAHSLPQAFARIPDPRRKQGRRCSVAEILSLAVVALPKLKDGDTAHPLLQLPTRSHCQSRASELRGECWRVRLSIEPRREAAPPRPKHTLK